MGEVRKESKTPCEKTKKKKNRNLYHDIGQPKKQKLCEKSP